MSGLSAEKQQSSISPKLLFRTSLTCSVIFALVAVALIVQQTPWSALLFLEVIFIIGSGELLARNLPRRIRRQIKLNQRRSNGSKSSRRVELEKQSVRRFKFSAMTCLGFLFIPINACVLAYAFFFPQLKELSDTFEFRADLSWLNFVLEPAFQIAALLMVFAMFSYGASKSIYFRLLRDLDSEICRRAENYSAYDLINPPAPKNAKAGRLEK